VGEALPVQLKGLVVLLGDRVTRGDRFPRTAILAGVFFDDSTSLAAEVIRQSELRPARPGQYCCHGEAKGYGPWNHLFFFHTRFSALLQNLKS
jgi:hypothetical protein